MEPDRDKVLAHLFDSPSSEIMALLEDGRKELSHLAKETGLEASQVESALAYLVECGLVARTEEGDDISYAADEGRLAEFMEDEKNYDSAIDGLTKMDGYLN